MDYGGANQNVVRGEDDEINQNQKPMRLESESLIFSNRIFKIYTEASLWDASRGARQVNYVSGVIHKSPGDFQKEGIYEKHKVNDGQRAPGWKSVIRDGDF